MAEWTFIGSLRVARPPLPQQIAIFRYLDDEITKTIHAAERTEREIELLRACRMNLITHVVTGKHGVREMETTLIAEPATFEGEGAFSKSVRSHRQDAKEEDPA